MTTLRDARKKARRVRARTHHWGGLPWAVGREAHSTGLVVIPAKAGTSGKSHEVPAFAGMTEGAGMTVPRGDDIVALGPTSPRITRTSKPGSFALDLIHASLTINHFFSISVAFQYLRMVARVQPPPPRQISGRSASDPQGAFSEPAISGGRWAGGCPRGRCGRCRTARRDPSAPVSTKSNPLRPDNVRSP